MKFWTKALNQLRDNPQTFENMLHVIGGSFGANIFSERMINNRTEYLKYADIIERAKSVCSSLKAAPITNSGFVGILMQNSPEYVSIFWGALMAGFKPLLLGSNVLRTETAALYGIAAIRTILLEKNSWILKG